MTLHSPIGASSMYRWGNCPGSVSLSKGLTSPESIYAKEGTRAHEIAAYYLQNQSWPHDAELEMVKHLEVYTNAVLEDKRSLDFSFRGNQFLIEHGFKLTQIHEQAFGTADCVIYDAKKRHLIVYDLKFGAGIPVEAEGNQQLKYYALGVLLSLDVPCATIELKIVQPRCDHSEGPIRVSSFLSSEILEFYNDLELAIERTLKPDAPLIPGSWCRFCQAAGICTAIHTKAMTTAKQVFDIALPYDPKDLADTLDKLPMLEGFVTQVREFAYAEAMKGRIPPGWKLVQKRATRKWAREDEDVAMLLSLHPKLDENNKIFALKLKSPTQIEKVLGKKDFEKFEALVSKESSGFKLAKESEPGEPIKLDAKSVFETVVDETINS